MQKPLLSRVGAIGASQAQVGSAASPGAAALGSDQEKKRPRDDFVVVEDAKSGAGVMKLRSALAAGGKGLPPLTVWLTLSGAANSGNSTPLTTVQALEPASFNEWSDLIALYEECKVEQTVVDFMITPVGSGNSPEIGVITYSPTVATALSSASQGAEVQKNMLFGVGIGGSTVPTPVTQTGLYRFKAKVPKGSVRSSGSAATFGGEWSATADASDVYGYLKWYVPSLGAAASSNLQYLMKMKVHFRSRQ